MHAETPKTISFQYKKVKLLHKYCPAVIETAFSTKFAFERYVFVAYSVALNINFKSTWFFRNTKIYRKWKFHGVWTKLEKICFRDSLGQNIVDKLMKLSKVDFSIECFTVDFLQFFRKTVKIYFLGWSGCSQSVLSISCI